MNIDYRISTIVEYMRKYQKKHNVKGACMTNTQYLYDCVRHIDPYVKAKAVMVVSDGYKICAGHLVLVLGDGKTLIDPSYEIYSQKNNLYCDNIKCIDFNDDERELKRNTLKDYIKFVGFAKKINDGGLLIHDKEYYNNQANYVEKLLKKRS